MRENTSRESGIRRRTVLSAIGAVPTSSLVLSDNTPIKAFVPEEFNKDMVVGYHEKNALLQFTNSDEGTVLAKEGKKFIIVRLADTAVQTPTAEAFRLSTGEQSYAPLGNLLEISLDGQILSTNILSRTEPYQTTVGSMVVFVVPNSINPERAQLYVSDENRDFKLDLSSIETKQRQRAPVSNLTKRRVSLPSNVTEGTSNIEIEVDNPTKSPVRYPIFINVTGIWEGGIPVEFEVGKGRGVRVQQEIPNYAEPGIGPGEIRVETPSETVRKEYDP